MNKHYRREKESKALETSTIIKVKQSWDKNWKNDIMYLSGCLLNISTLGGTRGFEAYIDGEAFDEFMAPAITQALNKTLEKRKSALIREVEIIEKLVEQ